MPVIRSRIKQFISDELMKELLKIYNNQKFVDNNSRVAAIREVLDKYEVDYVDLGPGTNRVAVLIDGYVFKIAMDKWGIRDNDNEFAMTQELQPFVINVYETNGLISVSEYVTLLSREDFIERKADIIKILGILAESYLLGDVGYHPKNFTNWGFRDDGSLVILDFAYIYNILGDEMLCPKDRSMLQYDDIFHDLICPQCRKKYSFMDVRRKVTTDKEMEEIQRAKDNSYRMTTDSEVFPDVVEDEMIEDTKENKEELVMENEKYITEEEEISSYEEVLNRLTSKTQYIPPEPKNPVEIIGHAAPVVESIDEEDVDEEEVSYEKMLERLNQGGSVSLDVKQEDEEEEIIEDLDDHEDDIEDDSSSNPLEHFIAVHELVSPKGNHIKEEEEVVTEVVTQHASVKVLPIVEEIKDETTQLVTINETTTVSTEILVEPVAQVEVTTNTEEDQNTVEEVEVLHEVEDVDTDDEEETDEDPYATAVEGHDAFVDVEITTQEEVVSRSKIQVSGPKEEETPQVAQTPNTTDLMAKARARLQVTLPNQQHDEVDEDAEREKYERLAREHGYTED